MSALFGIGVLGGLITDDPENICRVDMRVSETRLHSRVLDGLSRSRRLLEDVASVF